MDQHTYTAIASVYEQRHGEPLVAGEEWVGPLFEIVAVAVECDASLPPEFDLGNEYAKRTADVIAVITHGLDDPTKAKSDYRLAWELREAELDGDPDKLVYAENAVAARLALPLSQTEQGFTQAASDAIDEFCREQGFAVRGQRC